MYQIHPTAQISTTRPNETENAVPTHLTPFADILNLLSCIRLFCQIRNPSRLMLPGIAAMMPAQRLELAAARR